MPTIPAASSHSTPVPVSQPLAFPLTSPSTPDTLRITALSNQAAANAAGPSPSTAPRRIDPAVVELTSMCAELESAVERIDNGDLSDLSIVRRVADQMADPGRLSHLNAQRIPTLACRVLLAALSINMRTTGDAARIASALFGDYGAARARSRLLAILTSARPLRACAFGDMCAALESKVTCDTGLVSELHRLLVLLYHHLDADAADALRAYVNQVIECPSHGMYPNAPISVRLASHPLTHLPNSAHLLDILDGEAIHAYDAPGIPTLDGMDEQGRPVPQLLIMPSEWVQELILLKRALMQMQDNDQRHWQPLLQRAQEQDLRAQAQARMDDAAAAQRAQKTAAERHQLTVWAHNVSSQQAEHDRHKARAKALDRAAAATQGRNALKRQAGKRALTLATAEATRLAALAHDQQAKRTKETPPLPAAAAMPQLYAALGSSASGSMTERLKALDLSSTTRLPSPPTTPPSTSESVRRLRLILPRIPESPVADSRHHRAPAHRAPPLPRD